MVLENNEKANSFSVWLREDGIISAKIGKVCGVDDVEGICNEFFKIFNTMTGKVKIIVDVSQTERNYSAMLKKKMADAFTIALNDPKFDKFAMWGAKSKFINVITSFIIEAIGFARKSNNIKFFDTEEDAIKWLKE